jgi:hypothetical protein
LLNNVSAGAVVARFGSSFRLVRSSEQETAAKNAIDKMNIFFIVLDH